MGRREGAGIVSATTIEIATPKARKRYRCVWCGEWIEIGETHTKFVYIFDGLSSDRYHNECFDAQGKSDDIDWDEGFMPHEYKRGSTTPKWMNEEDNQ